MLYCTSAAGRTGTEQLTPPKRSQMARRGEARRGVPEDIGLASAFEPHAAPGSGLLYTQSRLRHSYEKCRRDCLTSTHRPAPAVLPPHVVFNAHAHAHPTWA